MNNHTNINNNKKNNNNYNYNNNNNYNNNINNSIITTNTNNKDLTFQDITDLEDISYISRMTDAELEEYVK